jgi:predicted nucleotidyltransferase
MRIAIDVMGGDNAPGAIIDGSVMAMKEYGAELYLVGLKEEILKYLGEEYKKHQKVKIIEASEIINVDEAPVSAIKSKKDSSMVVGLKLVKDGQCDAFVSAGSELGDTNTLHQLAELLQNEPEAFRLLLKKQLEKGVSYPKAVSDALSQYAGKDIHPAEDDILKNPNNVLGIEYIKALMVLKSSIQPVAIKRIGSSHNDTGISGYISSATAVRNEIKSSGISDKVKMSLPENSIDIIDKNLKRNRHPVFMNDFSDILLYKLRTIEKTELISYPGVKEGIENRLKKYADTSSSCEELVEAVKTKRYTRTYIQRLLCHVLLDIKNSDVSLFKSFDCPSYIRILAFNNSGKRLIKSIMDKCPYPVISKVADFKCADNRISRMFAYDVQATNIYNLAYRTPEFRKGPEDYLTSPYYHSE